jgi:Tol biopolymer transport system component/DNA-binding winged helix-turn-helix (wHTH) protein
VADTRISGYTFANFRLDLATHQLLRDGQEIPLGVKAFDTLVALIRHHPRVVTKDELIKWVWPDSFVSEDSLTHTVSALRRALGDDPAQPRFITTVARRGYRFLAPVIPFAPAEQPLPEPAPASADAAAPAHPIASPAASAGTPAHSRPGVPAHRLAWAIVGALVAVVTVLLIQQWQRRDSEATAGRALRFTQDLPPGTTLFSGGVLSPDGQKLAFVARDRSGRTQIWVRSLDSAEARPIEGTDNATRPFWSPDSQFLGFFAAMRVLRIGLTGDPPQALTPTLSARPLGGTWGARGVIVYSDFGRLLSVPDTGGTANELLLPDGAAREIGLRLPQFLPDGTHFIYSAQSLDPERAGIYLASLDDIERTRILDGSSSAATYSPDGYVLYVRDRVLLAQRFDAGSRRLAGEPGPIAGNVSPSAVISAVGGLLAFGGGTTAEGLVWFDRAGAAVGKLKQTALLNNATISPDQRQLLGASADPIQSGLWLVDLERGAATGLMSDGTSPVWAPDGNRIAFTATRSEATPAIYSRSTSGKNEDEVLLANDQPAKILQDWSPDGQFIVYVSSNRQWGNDLWLLPLSGARTPSPYLEAAANQIQAKISPNGRWITYASDESGSWEVYIQAFPVAGSKRRISVGGGAQPQWRGDGRELYYLSLDNTLMAVDIELNGSVEVGKLQPLFKAPVLGSLTDYRNLYVATRDGGRFLFKAIAEDTSHEPISILVNWSR